MSIKPLVWRCCSLVRTPAVMSALEAEVATATLMVMRVASATPTPPGVIWIRVTTAVNA